jgi:hypothetical protein
MWNGKVSAFVKCDFAFCGSDLPIPVHRLHLCFRYKPIPEDAIALVATERRIRILNGLAESFLDFPQFQMLSSFCADELSRKCDDFWSILVLV